MHFTRTINRLTVGMLILFGVVALSAAYWAIIGPDTILKRTDNPRLIEAESQIVRGNILDRDDTLLVTSEQLVNSSIARRYLSPEMNSALGYASLRYGVSGAESAYNSILRGDDQTKDFATTMLNTIAHQPRHGADIRLTFDDGIQRQIVSAMGSHQGAAVVLSVPSGEVLAMVSLPTFNPNTLDTNWEALAAAPGKPFFNRALQGTYQPGGILQSLLIAGAILSGHPLNESINSATRIVRIGNVSLECISQPPTQTLTLEEAYVFGCPFPFAKLADELGPIAVQSIFDTFRLGQPPTLPGYIFTPPHTATPQPPFSIINTDLIENTLGQGSITVSPMQMAVIAGAILNEGNAPNPHSLFEVRQSDSNTWIGDNTPHPSIPLTTAEVARTLQVLMRDSVRRGVAAGATNPGVDILGHAALAYSGEGTQAWFIGFVSLGNGQGIAIAVVVENSDNIDTAAMIGGKALENAYTRFRTTLPPTGGT
jgi:peptidoglycan glycosyltransferase